MAESERYLPVLIDHVEKVCEEAGLRHDSITMRMTGCPNGCARPCLSLRLTLPRARLLTLEIVGAAEVAFVGAPSLLFELIPYAIFNRTVFAGKAPGQYLMMLGGGYHGERFVPCRFWPLQKSNSHPLTQAQQALPRVG